MLHRRSACLAARHQFWGKLLPAVGAAIAGVCLLAAAVHAGTPDIPGPAGSGGFGSVVKLLPNGNIVVTDPTYDDGAAVDVGAVYLYDGETGALISRMTGSTANDRVAYGTQGITVLSSGDYLVNSQYWTNGTAASAGAVTWCSGTLGCSGVVSTTNSLFGDAANDQVGSNGVVELTNGNYVVQSQYWHGWGAATWRSSAAGIAGVVSAANSLVGSHGSDLVGTTVVPLTNGNYVVVSKVWDNGTIHDAGAVTWGNGTLGTSGAVTISNSLVGSTASDSVGSRAVLGLPSGNYVVASDGWDNGATADVGAVTWANGTTGIAGTITIGNSLIGSSYSDRISQTGLNVLTNGNYVVGSQWWDNGAITNVGAATWGSGATGVTGAVSVTNSLIGSISGDKVASYGIVTLANGNYVVLSPEWDNGAINSAGAATWGDGTTGITGVVATSNSLVGSTDFDQVPSSVYALTDGDYVVSTLHWDNGLIAEAGAATWADGDVGATGVVTYANSLVGDHASDQVGSAGVKPLANGNYVVTSPYWDNGTTTNAGAATWGDGAGGTTGVVSIANSLVGSTSGDQVGIYMGTLTNGNYVVRSPYWDNGLIVDGGAATWGDGTSGTTGVVSVTNSLVGSQTNDRISYDGVTALPDGNYVVASSTWDKGALANAGAATWGNGTTGTTGVVSVTNSIVGSTASDAVGSTSPFVYALNNSDHALKTNNWTHGAAAGAGAVTWDNGTGGVVGPITAANSVLGTAASGGYYMYVTPDNLHNRFIVGRPYDNIVSLLTVPAPVDVGLQKRAEPSEDVVYRTLVTYTALITTTSVVDRAAIFTDALPAGTSFAGWVEQPAGAQVAGGVVTWSGTVASGAPVTFTFQVTNTASAGDVVTNTAEFASDALSGSATGTYTTTAVVTPMESGNWSAVFPPCAGICNYVIPAGVTVTLDGDLALAGNLEVQGTLVPNSKTITCVGSSPQTLTGYPLEMYKLVINKTDPTDTVTAVGKLIVKKKLLVTKGKLYSASIYEDVEIETTGLISLTNPITVTGDFTNTGELVTNGNAVTFAGTKEQHLYSDGIMIFDDLNVMTGTTLVEVYAGDTLLVNGALANYGVIRKYQAVTGADAYSFGLAGQNQVGDSMEISVTTQAGLTGLQVDRVDANPATPPVGTSTVIYWTITPTGTGFTTNLTLPYAGLSEPTACRQVSGDIWNCARTRFDGTLVTRDGVTQFSPWAVYALQPSTTTVAAGPNPAHFGERVTLTATVAPAGAQGSVQFYAEGDAVGSAQLVAGRAVVTTTALAVGTHAIAATTTITAGAYLDSGSELSGGQQVDKAGTSVIVVSSPQPSELGQNVTITAAVVVSVPGAGIPTGVVTFTVDSTQTPATLDAGGVATYTTAILAAGVHTITAVYGGTPNLLGSTSAAYQQVVQPLPLAVNDATGTLEDNAVTIHVLANDFDPAQGGLVVSAITLIPAHGAATISPDQLTVIYTPAAGFTGLDSFVYAAMDVNGNSDDALAAIVVAAKSQTGESPEIAPVDPTVDSSKQFTSAKVDVDVALPGGFYTGTVGAKDILFLSYTPVMTASEQSKTPPANLTFGNFEFDLSLYVNNELQQHVQFAVPVTTTITYDPALLGGLNENTLAVYFWNGTAWSADGIEVVARDPVNHMLTVAISHLSDFAFFAAAPTGEDPGPEPEVTQRLFLPSVLCEGSAGGTGQPEAAWASWLYLPTIRLSPN